MTMRGARSVLKLRPFLSRNNVDSYTDEEPKAAEQKGDLQGLLVDYAARGSNVELEGVESVEGQLRCMDGRMRDVRVFQRDFRPVQGLMVPFVYETAVDNGTQTHRMLIDTVTVNRAVDDSRFTKPQQVVTASRPCAAGASAVLAGR
jgi:hypothetical protein